MSRFRIHLNVVFLCGFLLKIASTSTLDIKTSCGNNQWRCLDGGCIFLMARCDNYPDCSDSSDERGCNIDTCNESLRKCSSGECIEEHMFCNGFVDCLDASDELAADCQAKNSISTPKSIPNRLDNANTTHSIFSNIAKVQAPPPMVQNQASPVSVPLPVPIPIPPLGSNFLNKPVESSLELPSTNQDNSRDPTSITLYSAPSFPNKDSYPGLTSVARYLPTTSKNPCVPDDELFEFCRRRYRGYFQHPSECSRYIVCEWGFMYVCTCPEKTHWDPQFMTCVWDYAVPCDNGPVPPVPKLEPPVGLNLATQPTPVVTTTTMSNRPTITSPFVQIQHRLRSSLPVTPAWLKKLSETSARINRDKQANQYKSLLTRFFKAVPMETLNLPASQ